MEEVASCARADHGIGITGANKASFKSYSDEFDFGNDMISGTPTKGYSLNLWIR